MSGRNHEKEGNDHNGQRGEIMRNRVGLIIFGAGFLGILCFGAGLDSPGTGWQIALAGIGVSTLVGAIGYLLMDVEEVLNSAGLQRKKDSKDVAERKARNREVTWNNWIHGGYIN